MRTTATALILGGLVTCGLVAAASASSRPAVEGPAPVTAGRTAQPSATHPPTDCRGLMRAVGTATEAGPHAELQARHDAIANWRSAVSAAHGYDFTHWWKARNKAVTCKPGSDTPHCEAAAVPCGSSPGPLQSDASKF